MPRVTGDGEVWLDSSGRPSLAASGHGDLGDAFRSSPLLERFRKSGGRAVLVVNGISGVIQGVLGGLAFWLFNFQSAFLWGVIMGLLAFCPSWVSVS